MDFSIIIPAKNEEANIGRCLQSISELDYDPARFEVIVVDNGSSDKTVEIARRYGAVVFVLPELTVAGLRNFGAREAKGDILAFLDADCTVDNQWLKAASFYLERQHKIPAFGSPVILPENATWVQITWYQVRGKPEQIIPVEWLESANLFVLRKSFWNVQGFNEALETCEDYDLTQRLKSIGTLMSDFRVKAIHYREPATVKEFFKKEIWRSKSNYRGLLARKIDLNEVPSLVLPIIYGMFCLASALGILAAVAMGEGAFWLVISLCCWQFPIMLVSLRKGLKLGPVGVIRLFCLFNVYFSARSIGPLFR